METERNQLQVSIFQYKLTQKDKNVSIQKLPTVPKNFVVFLINCIVPSNGVTEKIEGPDKNGRLYDKAGGKVRKIKQEQKEADGEGKNQQAIKKCTIRQYLH